MEYYPRKIEKKLDEWLRRKEAILIKGPRQSGKNNLVSVKYAIGVQEAKQRLISCCK